MFSPEIDYGRAQLHIHTEESDGRGSIDQFLDTALATGMDIIAIADHDKITENAKNRAAQRNLPLEVAIAVEISSPKHIIGWFLNDNFPTTPPEMFGDLKKTIDWIKANGGYAFLAHPGVPLGIKPDKWPLFDAIEVFSPIHGLFRRDQLVINAFLHIPRKERPAPLGTGDIHFPTGRNWDFFTLIPGRTLTDLEKAIIEKNTIPYIEDFGLPDPSLIEWAYQIPRALILEPIEAGRIQAFFKHLHQ